MNVAEIELELKELVRQPFDPKQFPFRLLEIYDAPKATITKLRQGAGNQAKSAGDILVKNKLFFRVADDGRAAATVDQMASDPLVLRHRPRLLFATDGKEVYCRDTKADQSLDADFAQLNDSFDFFLPLAGIERYEAVAENPADIKATGRLAKLYDAILEANPDWIGHDHTHELDVFMTRVLFCFFAENTSIFAKRLFSSTVINITNDTGSNTAQIIETLFRAMDTPPESRDDLPDFARRFPWVNGGLFRDKNPVPTFSKRARRIFRECGDLDWSEINPDIFGSMIQAVVEPEMRGDMGMHYTSVPNIMKILQPLFLLSLEEEFEAASNSPGRLNALLKRIYNIRIFDPACGSGNFLIIAYRELRRLENKIFVRLNEIAKQWTLPLSGVRLEHFYGLELADFAVETAKLSLVITEYQTNEVFKEIFGTAPPALPLKNGGNILQGNATRVDWTTVCPKDKSKELYVISNPPYLGGKKLSPAQSEDMIRAGLGKMKQLDYVACWFIKAANFVKDTDFQFAFVATNSICQGEQVHLLWSYLFDRDLDISFAYEPFKWANNASRNAAVICTIVGLKPKALNPKKFIFSGTHGRLVKNISPYLREGSQLYVSPVTHPLNDMPIMCMGSNPVDGKHLTLTSSECESLLASNPDARKFVKRFTGGEDFIDGVERYCLWISESDVISASKVPFIAKRILECAEYRRTAGRDAKKVADRSYRFCYRAHEDTHAIIFPNTSTESRKYVPGGFTDSGTVINHAAFAVYGAEPFVLGILSSTMHRVWLAAVGGRLKNDFRYSVKLVYNTFPVPSLSSAQKQTIEDHVWDIIARREAHPGKNIAWLYDKATMPSDLFEAHRALDETLETIYIGRVFKNDTERLDHLFKLYAAMLKKIEASHKLKGAA